MDELSLGSRELKVMAALWEHGDGTVGEVRGWLDAELAYTTVLTILRNLESKGLLRHETEGRAYRYFPNVAKRVAERSAIAKLLDGFFGGSPAALLARLVDDHEVNADELRELSKRLATSSAERKRRKSC
jgi:BlaI family penicillinase repressor